MDKFVVLTGPSCIGKGPLYSALQRFYPEIASRFRKLVLFNDRDTRPGEQDGVDFFFRPRAEIEQLRDKKGYVVAEVRNDLQALKVAQIQQILDAGNIPFYEGNLYILDKLRTAGIFEQFPTLSVFLSPLSRDEIIHLKAPERKVDLAAMVADIQRRKLLLRSKRQKGILSLKDLEDIEKRCNSAIIEMREAWKFQHVIPLYDGEGNDNWDAFYHPIGNARKALLTFVALIGGDVDGAGTDAEWTEDLVP
ncbi:MAG: hypothetical protein HQL69_17640 [Magnetococcales bacterium]|nr:hypothetical protein [Magnetococcales bacterium]